MNDDFFADMARQMRPSDQVRAELERTLAAEESPIVPAAGASRRRGHSLGWLAGAAGVAIVAGLALAPGLLGGGEAEFSDPPRVPGPATGQDAGAPAGDYGELYAAVRAAAETSSGWAGTGGPALAGGVDGAVPAPQEAGAADRVGAWQTNAQVAGIDEGDITKSDGDTLYLVSGREVVVVDAAGEATRELARIDTSVPPAAPKRDTDTYVVQGPVVDLMLHGSTLVVLVTEYSPRVGDLPASAVSTFVPFDAAQTKALLYDVSDPGSPTYLTSLGQSGAYVTSRLVGSLLYLVTEYILADPDSIDPDDPETFVPLVSRDGERSALGAADCMILPFPDGPRYAVASSIDLSSRKRIDTESVLGGSQTVYLSGGNLFLAAVDYAAELSATDSARAGVDDLRQGMPVTRITRIKLDDGELTVAGQGSVPGVVLNQFALDEYGDHLRVAVTVSGETAKKAWTSRPALYVLNGELEVVGSLPKLAKNETIQSVRFDGPVGYVVSFERVDPLFALDLADPARPTVMSALKIPGFSTYLHPWSDGRLLGLGMAADSDGRVTGLKLSMFDTSDPFDVTEETSIKVKYDDSEALANHKAVLVDAVRGLIGFPAVSWGSTGEPAQRYLVYRYDAGKFSLVEKLPLQTPDGYGYGTRGLTIADHLYVVSGAGVDVYRADSFDKVAAVSITKR